MPLTRNGCMRSCRTHSMNVTQMITRLNSWHPITAPATKPSGAPEKRAVATCSPQNTTTSATALRT